MAQVVTEKTEGLVRKLAKVMGEIGRIEKRGRNDFHKYDYVLESDLVDAVRGLLAKAGVMIFPSVESYEVHGDVTHLKVKFTMVDGESGQTIEAYGYGQGADKGDKGGYKAMTGATKYFLMKTFLIATGDDPEGDTKVDERPAQKVTLATPEQKAEINALSEIVKGKQPSQEWLDKQTYVQATGVLAMLKKQVNEMEG